MKKRTVGWFFCVEILIVVAIIMLLAWLSMIAIPSFMKARAIERRIETTGK